MLAGLTCARAGSPQWRSEPDGRTDKQCQSAITLGGSVRSLSRSLDESYSGDAAAFGQQFLLSPEIRHNRVRCTRALMIEISAARLRQRILARCKPRLSYASLMKIIRRRGAAHLCRYPSRLQRIGFDVFPAARDGKCQQDIAQLALRVSRRATPGPLAPEQIVHTWRTPRCIPELT
jgi:hypothetical protein